MFPPEVQLIMNAQTALFAAQQNDPKFDELVARLQARLNLDKETVVKNIILLAQGNIF